MADDSRIALPSPRKGGRARINLTGRRSDHLTVTDQVQSVWRFKRFQVFWLCQCDCGTETWVLGELLRSGKAKSCGCRQYDKPRKPNAKRRDRDWKQAYNQAYYQIHKEQMDATARQYRLDHEEELRKWHSTYEKTPERQAFHRQWQNDNPGILRANNIKRRLLQECRTPSWADMDAINEIYRNCPPGMEVDHIVPLKGKTVEGYRVSGLHVPWNLQYLSITANRTKKNRMRPEDTIIGFTITRLKHNYWLTQMSISAR